MPVADLIFQRTIDLPPVIVWDALVDPELLAGWLGEVRLHPTDPPTFHLLWPGADLRQSTTGAVVALVAPELLAVETDNRGRLECTVTGIAGGLRGTSTDLVLRVGADIESAFAPRMRREWQTSLDRLESLLHGHPVDWTNLHELSDGTTGLGGTTGRSANSPR